MSAERVFVTGFVIGRRMVLGDQVQEEPFLTLSLQDRISGRSIEIHLNSKQAATVAPFLQSLPPASPERAVRRAPDPLEEVSFRPASLPKESPQLRGPDPSEELPQGDHSRDERSSTDHPILVEEDMDDDAVV